MKSLVTGAAGFVGSHLCETLVASGEPVVGVDNFSDYYDPALKRANLEQLTPLAGFELVETDLNSTDLGALLDDIDVVFHLAGQPGVRVSWGESFGVYLHENVLATQRLLEAARDAKIERFVFSSSSSVYGEVESYPTREQDTPLPISPYGVTKLAAENLCRLYQRSFGIPAVSLRYFSIYGPRQRPDMAFTRFIDAVLAGRPLEIYGDGLQSRDFTFVGDAVEATVAAASRGEPGAVYNVAGGGQVTVLEVVEQLSAQLGRQLEVSHKPASPGEPRITGADITAARIGLGYEPSVTFADGLAAQLEAHLSRHPAATAVG